MVTFTYLMPYLIMDTSVMGNKQFMLEWRWNRWIFVLI